MTEEDVLKELTPIFRNALNNNDIALSPEVTKDQVDGWDSFLTVELLIAIEERFQIAKLPLINAAKVASVRDLMNLVIRASGE